MNGVARFIFQQRVRGELAATDAPPPAAHFGDQRPADALTSRTRRDVQAFEESHRR